MSTRQATLNGEGVDFETLNHGGICDLCEKLFQGPYHEHLPACPAREDVFQQEHPEGESV